MLDKAKIKIIKRGDVKPSEPKPEPAVRTKSAVAREMVSNVSTWVSDFQTRKRDETKVAIEKFFGQNPQPSEL